MNVFYIPQHIGGGGEGGDQREGMGLLDYQAMPSLHDVAHDGVFQGIDSASLFRLRACTSNRVVVPARQTGNRFQGSLKGLQIRALLSHSPPASQAGRCGGPAL
jgi:hypothetical protein